MSYGVMCAQALGRIWSPGLWTVVPLTSCNLSDSGNGTVPGGCRRIVPTGKQGPSPFQSCVKGRSRVR